MVYTQRQAQAVVHETHRFTALSQPGREGISYPLITRSSAVLIPVVVLLMVIVGCGCAQIGEEASVRKDLGKGFLAMEPRTGEAGTAVRLVLSVDLRDPAQIRVRVGDKISSDVTILNSRTIVLPLPDCDPGVKSIEVLTEDNVVARV